MSLLSALAYAPSSTDMSAGHRHGECAPPGATSVLCQTSGTELAISEASESIIGPRFGWECNLQSIVYLAFHYRSRLDMALCLKIPNKGTSIGSAVEGTRRHLNHFFYIHTVLFFSRFTISPYQYQYRRIAYCWNTSQLNGEKIERYSRIRKP